ncbi:outer membrane efflux protein [Leptospira inadai serovar Lyme str. 10]|uniref:Outer membrane efflux protein n=2 Tax=Leptospira inadai serovar Lyme TaxID=293084 RepID=V6HC31_9LEPT|nr:TolC family protein [Leptospira inadai]EQA36323.1 outer membrane efflux protein [Leptospira inadai serovar Lyme str. 10]PNV75680.1 TolC family protein [Leptospira inadai serovar Lyme]
MKKKVLALLILATANVQSSETKAPGKLIAPKDDLVFENGAAADQKISSENSEPERLKVRLDMAKAEELLWKNNLLLLAAKYDIDARKAGIEQAGLYANPNIFIDQSIFAEPTRRYFDFTRSGQTVYQIQQLFLLGGKIDKRIRVAELNAKMGEQEFYDLARALLSKLRRTLYFIHYYREAISFYDGSLEALEKTVSSAELAYKRRAILQAELLRLKALLFFLRKEREDLRIKVLEKEADLRVLLNEEKYMDQGIAIEPVLNQDFVEGIDLAKIKLAEIVQTAREYRPDLRKAVQALRYEEANLELQHANAIPDLSFGPMYNRGGTAFQNYWGVTAQLNIPIFDRNQGNIKAAEKSILVKKQELKNRILEVENEVNVALATAKAKDGLYRRFRNTYTKDYTDLAQDMILSYEKRYISVLEFADFFETYRSSIVEMLRLQTDRMDAIEGVNYSVGSGVLVPNKPSVESGNN